MADEAAAPRPPSATASAPAPAPAPATPAASEGAPAPGGEGEAGESSLSVPGDAAGAADPGLAGAPGPVPGDMLGLTPDGLLVGELKAPLQPDMAALYLRISNAFKVFDAENNSTVDVREIGTIVRSLGCCPSEEQISDIIVQCEEEEPTGYIKYSRFEPVMAEILKEKRYRSVSEDMVLRAFATLDQDAAGFLSPDQLTKFLSDDGEPFTPDELEEMLVAAVDPEKKVVFYKEHAAKMALDEDVY